MYLNERSFKVIYFIFAALRLKNPQKPLRVADEMASITFSKVNVLEIQHVSKCVLFYL